MLMCCYAADDAFVLLLATASVSPCLLHHRCTKRPKRRCGCVRDFTKTSALHEIGDGVEIKWFSGGRLGCVGVVVAIVIALRVGGGGYRMARYDALLECDVVSGRGSGIVCLLDAHSGSILHLKTRDVGRHV